MKTGNEKVHLDKDGNPTSQAQNWMPPADIWDVEARYPWSNIGDEVLPSATTKKDFFDSVVKYPTSKIKDVFHKSKLAHYGLFIMDSNYYCLPKDKVDQMVSEIGTNNLHYLADRNDCDKFALKFVSECVWTYGSNGVGIVLDPPGKHAYSCIIVAGANGADPTIEVVEPQQDRVISTPDAHHTFKSGRVILF